MEVQHLLAVTGDDAEGALANATAFLDVAVERVFDYETDYRLAWDGPFPGHDAILPYAPDSERFRQAVVAMQEARDRTFRGLRDQLTGTRVRPDDLPPETVMGLPIGADRISAHNAEMAATFQSLLASETLPDESRDDHGSLTATGEVGWLLRRLGTLVEGEYCFESMFYDTVAETASPRQLYERCDRDPTHQWLVAVDLHI
ncbi:MAG: hypothetical protein JO086_02335 [Acidimicrobiia bacterium]|nr:hypothetical protein [Acidimicrobiia bacterium]